MARRHNKPPPPPLSPVLLDAQGRHWNTGSADLELHHPLGQHTIQTAVRCRVEGDARSHSTLLDTGSSHTVIGGQLADEAIERFPKRLGRKMRHSSRFGLSVEIDVILMRVELVNNWAGGRDYAREVEALLHPDLPDLIVLGLQGFLEHSRIALDPGGHPEVAGRFYFGPLDYGA